MAMEIDDDEDDDPVSVLEFDKPITEANFFNSFEDDFDDADIA